MCKKTKGDFITMQEKVNMLLENKWFYIFAILFFGQIGLPFLLQKKWVKALIAFLVLGISSSGTAFMLKLVWIGAYLIKRTWEKRAAAAG